MCLYPDFVWAQNWYYVTYLFHILLLPQYLSTKSDTEISSVLPHIFHKNQWPREEQRKFINALPEVKTGLPIAAVSQQSQHL